MRGGWGLDALGKFFRRRRRRRPPGFGKWAVIVFYYEAGAAGVRGSIRLVFRVPKVLLQILKFCMTKIKYQKRVEKKSKTVQNRPSIKNPL